MSIFVCIYVSTYMCVSAYISMYVCMCIYPRINFYLFIYCGLFPLILVVFCVVSSFITFRPNSLWPSSGDLPRPRIGMLSLVIVSPVITAFHSCCLSHHIFDQVNLWPAWVGFETAIF